jgi:hypothetical protein
MMEYWRNDKKLRVAGCAVRVLIKEFYRFKLVTRTPNPVTRNPQPATRNSQPVTRNPYPVTRNSQPVPRNP